MLVSLTKTALHLKQKKKKHRRRTTTTESSVDDDVMNMLEADEAADASASVEHAHESKAEPLVQEDPCLHKHCGAGRVCQVDNNSFTHYTYFSFIFLN